MEKNLHKSFLVCLASINYFFLQSHQCYLRSFVSVSDVVIHLRNYPTPPVKNNDIFCLVSYPRLTINYIYLIQPRWISTPVPTNALNQKLKKLFNIFVLISPIFNGSFIRVWKSRLTVHGSPPMIYTMTQGSSTDFPCFFQWNRLKYA